VTDRLHDRSTTVLGHLVLNDRIVPGRIEVVDDLIGDVVGDECPRRVLSR
jgi:hypothetical protein